MTTTGRTLTYGLIGDPIEHVKTPELYNEKLAERGIDVAVVPMHVRSDALGELVRLARGWQNLVGIGVTIPHKEAMTRHLDELTESARLCGATNVIRRNADGRLVGTQMDGPGFVWSLTGTGFDPAGHRALLVGAGGTARALAFELASADGCRLTITNRTREKAEKLATSVRDAYPACAVEVADNPTGEYDLIVNATSVGMKDADPLPVDPAVLNPGTIVADVVMSPPETALLREARRRGCTTHPGRLMLAAQFEATVRFLGLDGRGLDGGGER